MAKWVSTATEPEDVEPVWVATPTPPEDLRTDVRAGSDQGMLGPRRTRDERNNGDGGGSFLDHVRATLVHDEAARAQVKERYGLTREQSFFPGMGAEMLAAAPTDVGGALGWQAGAQYGARLGSRAGVTGGLLGAVGGATLGDLYRRAVGAGIVQGAEPPLAMPPPGSGSTSLREGALTAALMGVPEIAGKGFAAVKQRLMAPRYAPGAVPVNIGGTRGTYDFSLDQRQRVNRNVSDALATGVDTTPAELLDHPNLKDREALMRLLPGSSHTMDQFLTKRGTDVQNIVDKWARSFSKGDGAIDPEAAKRVLGEGGRSVLTAIRRNRRSVTEPLYARSIGASRERFNVDALLRPLQAEMVEESGAGAAAYEYIVSQLSKGADAAGTVSAKKLHTLQSDLGGRAQLMSTQPNVKRLLRDVAGDFSAILNERVPGYADAGVAYAALSRGIRDVERGFVAVGLREKQDVVTATTDFFKGEPNPGSVKFLRETLEKWLPKEEFEDVWGNFVTGDILSQINKIQPLQSGDPLDMPGKMQAILGGIDSAAGGLGRRQVLKELIPNPQHQKNLKRMVRAFKNTAGMTNVGSRTAIRQTQDAQIGSKVGALMKGAFDTSTMGLTRVLVNAAPKLAEDFVTGNVARNRLYAEAIAKGTQASSNYIDSLDKAIQLSRMRTPEEAERILTRAWSALFASTVKGEGSLLEKTGFDRKALAQNRK